MAKIFENRTTNYDGLSDVEEGEGVIFVYFNVDKPQQSTLKLLVRKTGTTDPFVELRRDSIDAVYKADVTGLDYYFKWEKARDHYNVKGTLDV